MGVKKISDLYPPLGVKGGPCRVVDRILRRNLPPESEKALVDEVESNQKLDNGEATEIYGRPLKEKTTQAPLLPYIITPHAQYRMDLRGVTVKDLNAAISDFFSSLQRLRAKNESEFQTELRRRVAEGWQAGNGLFLSLKVRDGEPVVVTAYWPKVQDPQTHPGACLKTAKPEGEYSGIQTFVSEKPSKGVQESSGDSLYHPPGESPKSDRSRTTPERTDTRENLEQHPPGNWSYNTPGPSTDTGPVPKTDIGVRSPGTPGDQYGHPFKENVTPRRTEGGLYPSYSKRQHEQRGDAKKYYQRYYRRNKGKIKLRAEKLYRKVRKNPEFLRTKTRRQDPAYASKFRRLPFGGARTIAERSRKEREKKGDPSISFWDPYLGFGSVESFDGSGVSVLDSEGVPYEVDFLDFLDETVFLDDLSVEAFFALVDDRLGDRTATYYRETFTPGDSLDPGEGAQDLGAPSPYAPFLNYPSHDLDTRPPAESLNNIREVDNNPGSAKVIPSGHGFANKEASSVRIAKKMLDILRGLSQDVLKRSHSVDPKLHHEDAGIYTFRVGSQGSTYYEVVVQALGGTSYKISCSCPFWRWQGPEYHAHKGGYLYGIPKGAATKPGQRDPKSEHKSCKHAVACLDLVVSWSKRV